MRGSRLMQINLAATSATGVPIAGDMLSTKPRFQAKGSVSQGVGDKLIKCPKKHAEISRMGVAVLTEPRRSNEQET